MINMTGISSDLNGASFGFWLGAACFSINAIAQRRTDEAPEV